MLRHGTAFSNTRRGPVQRTSCIRWHVGTYGFNSMSATCHQCSMDSSASLSSPAPQYCGTSGTSCQWMTRKPDARRCFISFDAVGNALLRYWCTAFRFCQNSRPCCRHKQCPNILHGVSPAICAAVSRRLVAAGACPECGRQLTAAQRWSKLRRTSQASSSLCPDEA